MNEEANDQLDKITTEIDKDKKIENLEKQISFLTTILDRIASGMYHQEDCVYLATRALEGIATARSLESNE